MDAEKTESTLVFDAESQEEHPPELYASTAVAETIDTSMSSTMRAEPLCPGGLLAVENAFNPVEVRDALSGLDELVTGRREGYTGISSKPARATCSHASPAGEPARCGPQVLEIHGNLNPGSRRFAGSSQVARRRAQNPG